MKSGKNDIKRTIRRGDIPCRHRGIITIQATMNGKNQPGKLVTQIGRQICQRGEGIGDRRGQANAKGMRNQRTITASIKVQAANIATSFGDILLPSIEDGLGVVSDILAQFAAMPASTQQTIVGIAGVTAAIGPLLLVGGKLITLFGTIGGLLTGPAGWVALGVAGVAGLTIAMDKLGDSSDRAWAKARQNADPGEVAAYKEAFGKIDTTIDTSVTVNGDPQAQVQAAVDALHDALSVIDVLTDDERAAILLKIGEDVDPVLAALQGAGIDTTTEGGSAVAAKIIAASTQLKTAITGISLFEGEGGAAALAGLIDKDKATIVAALTESGVEAGAANAAADAITGFSGALADAFDDVTVMQTLLGAENLAKLLTGDKKTIIAALTEKGFDKATADTAAKAIVKAGKELNGAVKGIDALRKGMDAETLTTALTEDKKAIMDALISKGATEEQAETAATAIIAARDELSGAVAGLNTVIPAGFAAELATTVSTGKSGLVEALKGLGLTDEDLAPVIAALTTAQASLAGSVSSIYDTIYSKLTDGKPDTQAQTEALTKTAQEYFNGLMAGIDLNTEAGQGYASELAGIQKATLGFITEMSGQSAAAVEASKGELEALAERARKLAAEIMGLTAEAGASNNNLSVRMVKAGVSSAPEKVAEAFDVTYQEYGLDRFGVMQKADKKRQDADTQWGKDTQAAGLANTPEERKALAQAAEDAYREKISDIDEGEKAALAGVEGKYRKNLNELFQGLGENGENQEIAEGLKGLADDLNLADSMAAIGDQIIKNLDEGKGAFEGISLTDEIVQKLLGDDSATTADLNPESYMPEQLLSMLTNTANSVKEKVEKQFSEQDWGSMRTVLDQAIETGLLSGTTIDTETLKGKIALMLGQLDIPSVVKSAVSESLTGGEETAPDPLPVDVPVTAEPTVDASGVAPAVETAARDAVAGGVTVDAPVTVKTVPTVVTGDSGDTGASGAATVKDYVDGVSDGSGDAKSAAQGVAKAAVAGLGSQSAGARSAGRRIGQKFVEGMSAMLPQIRAKARQMATEAIAAANAELGGGGGGDGDGGPIPKGAIIPKGLITQFTGAFATDEPGGIGTETTGGTGIQSKGATAQGMTVNVTFPGAVVRSDRDKDAISRQVARRLNQINLGYGLKR